MRYHYTTIRRARMTMVAMPNADEDVEKLDHSYIVGRNVKWNKPLGSFL